MHITGHAEKKSGYYDDIYATGYDTFRYQLIYRAILESLGKLDSPRVLEIGCGVGDLGKMIVANGIPYRGFDFSAKAIECSRAICPEGNFWVGDAYDRANYLPYDYNVAIALEVLEHTDDLRLIENIPAGVHVLASVPDFDDIAHLRVYQDPRRDIVERFKPYLDVVQIIPADFEIPNTGYKSTIFIFHAIRKVAAQIAKVEEKDAETGEQLDRDTTEREGRTISACMIVKNEEKLLTECLRSIKGAVDEIVLVDTGSTDKTKKIAAEFGCVIYDYQWHDDFSAARNFSISKATKDWILIIDADERLVNPTKFRQSVQDTDKDVIWMTVINVYPESKITTCLKSTRAWRRELNLAYTGIIHNRLVIPQNATHERTEQRIIHLGYGLSDEKMQAKMARTKKLLKAHLKENPNDPAALMNLAQLHRVNRGHFNVDQAPDIFVAARRAAELTDPRLLLNWNIHVQSLDIAGWAALNMSNYNVAVECAMCALTQKRDFLDPALLMGYALMGLEDYNEAKIWFKRYIEMADAYNPDLEADSVIVNHMSQQSDAWNCIGKCLENQNQMDAAINHYMTAIIRQDGHAASYDSLNRLYTQGRLSDGEWQKVWKRRPEKLDAWPGEPVAEEKYLVPIRDFIHSATNHCGRVRTIKPALSTISEIYDEKSYIPYDPPGENDEVIIVAEDVLDRADDFRFLRALPVGVRLIATVPSFHSNGNLRRFRGENSFKDRYDGILQVNGFRPFTADPAHTIFVADTQVIRGIYGTHSQKVSKG